MIELLFFVAGFAFGVLYLWFRITLAMRVDENA